MLVPLGGIWCHSTRPMLQLPDLEDSPGLGRWATQGRHHHKVCVLYQRLCVCGRVNVVELHVLYVFYCIKLMIAAF